MPRLPPDAAPQIQHCRFYPGNYMNSGTQINVCKPRPPASRSAKVLRTSVERFCIHPAFYPPPAESHLPAFTDFLAAGNFPYASVTGIILIITILRVKNGACAPLRFISYCHDPPPG